MLKEQLQVTESLKRNIDLSLWKNHSYLILMKQFTFLKVFSLLFLAIFNESFCQTPIQVKTQYGILEGFHDESKDLDLFLGVPFAQPPVEDLRWKAPQPLQGWEGIKEVKNFSPSAVQSNVFGDMIYRGNGTSEDCLYLNIWTPSAKKSKDLPVLVYFYGGGFVAGDGSEPRYDGASMAQKGIVSVTVNYRLNIFGFFAYPGLSAESTYNASGNYGLLDQNAALQWVYNNIEKFGGDPEKITIAGESAGSVSVSAHMASPLSKPFIAGAIGESGASIKPTLSPVPLEVAENIGAEFAKRSGYTLSELKALSQDELFKLYNESNRFGFPIVIDSYFLPKRLSEIFRSGEQANIPLIVGWNSAEVGPEAIMQGKEPTKENYILKLKELYPEEYEKVLKLYPAITDEQVRQSAAQLASDRFISYSTWKWFDLHRKNSDSPVYRYLFSYIRPSATEETVEPIGAAHASEIEYFLGNLPLIENPNLTKVDYLVSEKIQNYLANFIKTGNPNSEDLLFWPAAKEDDDTPPVLIMDKEFKVINAGNDDRYRFLDIQYGNQKKSP